MLRKTSSYKIILLIEKIYFTNLEDGSSKKSLYANFIHLLLGQIETNQHTQKPQNMSPPKAPSAAMAS